MAFVDEAALFVDTTFIAKVEAALKNSVSNVLQESSSGNLANDSKRRTLAINYIESEAKRDEIVKSAVRLAAANNAIEAKADNPATITDGEVTTAVNNSLNRLAGINVNNPNI